MTKEEEVVDEEVLKKKQNKYIRELTKHSREIAINSKNIRSNTYRNKKEDEVLDEMAKVLKAMRSHSKNIALCNKKIKELEETVYCLYSNIKSNQFLHACEVSNEA